MRTKSLLAVLLLGALLAALLAACGTGTGSTGARDSASPTVTATGEPIKIGFDEGFTGFMALDTMLVDHGIRTALAELDSQVLGRPIEYIKADNGSDPVGAVDKARQLVESDKIAAMLGPMFSPSNAAVTEYLSRNGGIPSISFMGQPYENMKTANKLSFIPTGFFSVPGYYLGDYAAGQLGYKTANVICFEDTASRGMVDGFKKAFIAGGGTIISETFLPYDTMDFAAYLTSMKPADCTVYWIFGNASAPFIKQYKDYGLTAPLLALQASCLTEQQLQELGDLVVGVKGVEYYVNTLDNPLNKKFVEDYRRMWKGEYPNLNSWGGWVAVNLFVNAVKETNGDTSPAALKAALSTATLDTPSGPYTMAPFEDAFTGTGNIYICEVQKDQDRYKWVAIHSFDQVRFTDVSGM